MTVDPNWLVLPTIREDAAIRLDAYCGRTVEAEKALIELSAWPFQAGGARVSVEKEGTE